MESKKDIRKRILHKRVCMEEPKRHQDSLTITKKVISHPAFCAAKEIACYVTHGNEVETQKIIKEAWRLHKKVSAPKVSGEDMDFYYFHSFSDLAPGPYGILEPPKKHRAETLRKDCLMIIPGAVFDPYGARIGYGKGYYDRYLQHSTECIKMALGFSFQVVEHIMQEKHDIRMDYLITEEREYDTEFTEGSGHAVERDQYQTKGCISES